MFFVFDMTYIESRVEGALAQGADFLQVIRLVIELVMSLFAFRLKWLQVYWRVGYASRLEVCLLSYNFFFSSFISMESPTDAEELNLCILYHAHLPKTLTCLLASPNCRNTHIAELLGLVLEWLAGSIGICSIFRLSAYCSGSRIWHRTRGAFETCLIRITQAFGRLEFASPICGFQEELLCSMRRRRRN